MAKKKTNKKKIVKKSIKPVVKEVPKTPIKKKVVKKIKPSMPTLNLKTEHDIAMDFAVKTYKKFDKIVKSIVLFGSTAKRTQKRGSAKK